jgi:hypothetical protein
VDSTKKDIFVEEVYLPLGRMYVDIKVLWRHPILIIIGSYGDNDDVNDEDSQMMMMVVVMIMMRRRIIMMMSR